MKLTAAQIEARKWVIRQHGTSNAAVFFGTSRSAMSMFATSHEMGLPQRRPTVEEIELRLPRWNCYCPLCRGWRRGLASADQAPAAAPIPPKRRRRPKRDDVIPDWFATAACRGKTYLFYAPDQDQIELKVDRLSREARAKAICAVCPHRKACLEHALVHRERHGIWGGATEAERNRATVAA